MSTPTLSRLLAVCGLRDVFSDLRTPYRIEVCSERRFLMFRVWWQCGEDFVIADLQDGSWEWVLETDDGDRCIDEAEAFRLILGGKIHD